MSRYHCINRSGPRKGKLKKGYYIRNKRCYKAKSAPKRRGRRGASRRSSGGLKPCQRRLRGRTVLKPGWKYRKGGGCVRVGARR